MRNYIGQVIKGYEVRSFFGEGGFGTVYRAYQPALKREVAIKVILPEFADHPDFIRRFEFEAQVIAGLEHPHIVPLYDYWREADHAYLVMRALSTNLSAALEAGAWSTEAIGRLLDQIASALTVAHRNHIIHRDIKPDNILLDENRNAYLADFGIASRIESSTTMVPDIFGLGSIAYISPEQFRRQPLSVRADIFSLGIVLFQMLTGTLPFSSETVITDLIDKQLAAVFPSLSAYRQDLPDAINTVIQRATDKEPDNRYPDALSLAAAYHQALQNNPAYLEVAAIYPDLVFIKPTNPYKGLRAFEEIDQDRFFGRQALANRLLEHLNKPGNDGRFLGVIGPSGSGKSSVIRAGLLPLIRQGILPNSNRWFIMDMLPGADPFVSLDAAIQSVAVNPPSDLLGQLQISDNSLSQIINAVLPPDPEIELLLFVDQFEEIFTQVDDEPIRARFLSNLANAVSAPNSRLRVIIALRADFVDRPLHYAMFGELLSSHNEFVLPLSAEALEMAIVGPAQRVGVKIQAEVTAAMVSEVFEQPGALPLLQFALTELFEQQHGGMLTMEMYRANGGVLGSVARQAETLFTSLDSAGQFIARQFLLRLVTPGEEAEDTRRRVGRAELASLAVEQTVLDTLLDTFSRYRLLTFDNEMATRSPTVEVAHEALIRTWPRLRDWVNASRQELQIQRRMLTAAAEWINAGREASFLADGTRLQQFENWAKDTTLAIGTDEAEYLKASIAQQRERQALEVARKTREARTARLAANFQRITVGLAVVGVMALIAVIALGTQVRQAMDRVTTANGLVATAQLSLNSLGLAAEANKILLTDNGNVEVAALLGIRALKSAYLPEADTALRQAVERDYTEHIYSGHTDAVYAVAFSPDGKLAVSAGADNKARLWDVQSGKTLKVFMGHDDAIVTVAFSPDGQYVLTGSKDTTARLWDINTGQAVRVFAHRIAPVYEPGPYSAVNSVSFSPDGQYILTGTREPRVRLWNIKTGLTIRTFFDPDNITGVFGVAFSTNGRQIVVGMRNGKSLIWDVQTGQKVNMLEGHTGAVWAVAYSPDGSMILTGSGDDTARLWDAQTGQTLRIFQGHLSDVTGVAFSPDGKSALTVSADATARLWDVQTGQQLREFTGHTDAVYGGAFSPDGSSILTASSDHTVRVWDAVPTHNPYIFASHPAAVWSVAFSHNGKYVLTGSDDKTAQLWDVQSKQKLLTFSGLNHPVYSVVFSPDDKFVLTTGDTNVAQLWDTQTGQKIREFKAFSNSKFIIGGFSLDGKIVFTGGDDTVLRLWDIQSAQLLRSLTGHTGPIETAAFSPDGSHILTGSYDHTARVWDVQTGQVLQTLTDHTDVVNSVAYSPDGAFMLTGSGDNTARLWDVKTGLAIRVFIGHTGGVTSVAFSSDGKSVLTGSADATLQLWDAKTGKSLRTFVGHTKSITSVAFSPDQKYVVSGSTDDTVRLWETDYRDFVTYACTRLANDFTENQRLHFQINDKSPTCPQFVMPTTPATAAVTP